MLTHPYQFALEFSAQDGRSLARVAVPSTAFEPAYEWAVFRGLRAGLLTLDQPSPDGRIEPRYLRAKGPPFARGFRVQLLGAASDPADCEFPKSYFRRLARRALAALLRREPPVSVDSLRYDIVAYGQELPAAPEGGFTVTSAARALPFRPVSVAALTRRSLRFGPEGAGEFPVYLPQPVLAEAAALTLQAQAVETGGILIGHLGWDAAARELAVEVTAQIPARHAEGKLDELVFTPATWAAARDAIQLRGAREVMLGWWHSHPSRFFCSAQCTPEARRQCPLRGDFFSEDDVMLHETVFPKPFHVALVITHHDEGLRHALFASQAGVIAPRGFWILDGDQPLAAAEIPDPGEPHHATPCS